MKYMLTLFYRRNNPLFFSIENVFGKIAGKLNEHHAAEMDIREVRAPLPSGYRTILQNSRFLSNQQSAINHITGDIHFGIMACSKKNIRILTVHDCVSLQFFRKWDPRYWIIKWLWYSWPVKYADVVTVISERTKSELMAITAAPDKKIRVITNFVDPDFKRQDKPFNATQPRILFIGSTPNKNLLRLAEALKGIPAILDIVGTLTPESSAALDRLGIRYQQSSGLSKDLLVKKYEDCDLLAFPSTYEGFGLPIVEAQAVGRPVLTSSLSPMQDVAGKGAVLVDPYDPASIRNGLLAVIANEAFRNDLVLAGFANTSRFSLDKIAEEYMSLYREMIQQKFKTENLS